MTLSKNDCNNISPPTYSSKTLPLLYQKAESTSLPLDPGQDFVTTPTSGVHGSNAMRFLRLDHKWQHSICQALSF